MSLGPVMVDVPGGVLTDDDRRRLMHPLVGGVILFARNYQSSAQLMALTADIRALRTPHLLIAVDHEGGRVQRFRDGRAVAIELPDRALLAASTLAGHAAHP